MKWSSHYYVALVVVLLACCQQVERSNAFSPSTTSVGRRRNVAPTVIVVDYPTTFMDSSSVLKNPSSRASSSSTTTLFSSEPPETKSGRTNQIIGLNRGAYIMGMVLLLNVWVFSIPPEFRRAKICTEEQVVMFPNSGCMTGGMWVDGVKEYYANGGGVHFDFTIDKSQQPAWMGGEMPSQKVN